MKRVMKTEGLRDLEKCGERCSNTHPMLGFIRCERRTHIPGQVPHYAHHAEARKFEWTND